MLQLLACSAKCCVAAPLHLLLQVHLLPLLLLLMLCIPLQVACHHCAILRTTAAQLLLKHMSDVSNTQDIIVQHTLIPLQDNLNIHL
jgi:hypothetical protein